jgi:hypothetical protein
MITEELYKEEREIIKIISLMCANGISGTLKFGELKFNVRFKEYRNGQINFSTVECNKPGTTLEDFKMRPLEAEVVMGANVFLFTAIPVGEKSISLPDAIKSHPKRKAVRIKVAGNPFISRMYAIVTLKVVDPSIQDEELSRKIHLILTTIESTLIRSENYDIAKITLFDGTEKNPVLSLVKERQKPFVVFDTFNFSIKDETVLTYEDYVKYMNESGVDSKGILAQLDKLKEFYRKHGIRSEATVPLIFEDEVIGVIKVVSLKEVMSKPNVIRLNQLAIKAVDDLFTKCAFEIISKNPQTIIDIGVNGAKIEISEPDFYKYLRLMKRMYIQIIFPDETMIKTMATIVNIYDPTPEGHKLIGIRFSANMDWKDKNKLDEFIQSVVRLQNSELLA